MKAWFTPTLWLLCALLYLPLAVRLAVADSASFHIAAQPMPTALALFATQAKVQVLYDYKAISAVQCNPVEGELDIREALTRLLRNTGLEASFSSTRAVTVRPVRNGGAVPPRSHPDPARP
jgi:hypothetical protein